MCFVFDVKTHRKTWRFCPRRKANRGRHDHADGHDCDDDADDANNADDDDGEDDHDDDDDVDGHPSYVGRSRGWYV